MKKPKRILFTLVGITAITVAGFLSIWLAAAWIWPPTSVPAASITLLGYTNIVLANPNTNVFVYPERGNWISAKMLLRNDGATSILYGAWGNEPYGWANVQGSEGSTNGYLAPPFTGGNMVLGPGMSQTFWVILPKDTIRWQCGFSVETPSVRERGIWIVSRCRVPEFLRSVCFGSLRMLLPDKAGPQMELKTKWMEIDRNILGSLGSSQESASPKSASKETH